MDRVHRGVHALGVSVFGSPFNMDGLIKVEELIHVSVGLQVKKSNKEQNE